MNQAVIIDVVLLAVLAAAFVLGARRGLFKSLAGLAVLLVSLVCAIIISNALTAPVMEIIHPMLEQKITEKLDEAMAEPEIPALESGEEESSVWQEAWAGHHGHGALRGGGQADAGGYSPHPGGGEPDGGGAHGAAGGTVPDETLV